MENLLKYTQGKWIVKICHGNDGITHTYELCLRVKDIAELNANAQLIQAAPQLYRACIQGLKYISGDVDSLGEADIISLLLTAINDANRPYQEQKLD